MPLDVRLVELEAVQYSRRARAAWRPGRGVVKVLGDVITVTDDVTGLVVAGVIDHVVVVTAARRLLVTPRCRRDGEAPRHDNRCNPETERRRDGRQDDVARGRGDASRGVDERLNGPSQLRRETPL